MSRLITGRYYKTMELQAADGIEFLRGVSAAMTCILACNVDEAPLTASQAHDRAEYLIDMLLRDKEADT